MTNHTNAFQETDLPDAIVSEHNNETTARTSGRTAHVIEAKRSNPQSNEVPLADTLEYITDDKALGTFPGEESQLCQSVRHFQRMIADIADMNWKVSASQSNDAPTFNTSELHGNDLEPTQHHERRTLLLLQKLASGWTRRSRVQVGRGGGHDLSTVTNLLHRPLDDDGVQIPLVNAIASGHILSKSSATRRGLFRLSCPDAGSFFNLIPMECTHEMTYEHFGQEFTASNVVDMTWLLQTLLGPKFAYIAHPVDVASTTSILRE
jgi:hypothetical protein